MTSLSIEVFMGGLQEEGGGGSLLTSRGVSVSSIVLISPNICYIILYNVKKKIKNVIFFCLERKSEKKGGSYCIFYMSSFRI